MTFFPAPGAPFICWVVWSPLEGLIRDKRGHIKHEMTIHMRDSKLNAAFANTRCRETNFRDLTLDIFVDVCSNLRYGCVGGDRTYSATDETRGSTCPHLHFEVRERVSHVLVILTQHLADMIRRGKATDNGVSGVRMIRVRAENGRCGAGKIGDREDSKEERDGMIKACLWRRVTMEFRWLINEQDNGGGVEARA